MATCRTTCWTRLICTALLCAAPALAELSNTDPTSSLGKMDPGSVESSFQIPAPPTLTPATQAPPMDRFKSQVAAKALGMGAASQEKIQCYMMMSKAMEENNDLLMALAMQMCAQADQMMMSAMKNDQGIKLVSSADIPKQAELKAPTAQLGKDKVKEAEVPHITFNDDTPKGNSGDIPMPAAFKGPDLSQVFNQPKEGADLKDPITQFVNPPPPQTSELPAIDSNRNKTDEGQKTATASGPSAEGRGAFGGPGISLPAKGTPEDRAQGAAKPAPALAIEHPAGRKSQDRVVTAGTGDAGGSSSSGGSGSSFDLQGLMEQMMGGPPANGEAAGMLEVIRIDRKNPEEPPPNLFEYASYRYQKLATEKGAIKRRKINGIRIPARSTVAQASRE